MRNDHDDADLIPPAMIAGLETALRDVVAAASRSETRSTSPSPRLCNATRLPSLQCQLRGWHPAAVSTEATNRAVVDAFLCVMVELMARYRDCFVSDDQGQVKFSSTKFIKTRPTPLREVRRGPAAIASDRLHQTDCIRPTASDDLGS